ncbi:MAG: restriction endonuclease [Tissierellia bacterium]|nr:restriction endonuclease [Tissierellia bacterium]
MFSTTEEFFIAIFSLSTTGLMVFGIWFILSHFLKKDKTKPKRGLILSAIVSAGSFFIVLFSLKALLLVISIYLIIRYKREYDKKRSEELRLEEEKWRMEMEERERMVEKTLKLIFSDYELGSRLKEFIIQHTKRFDYGEIGFDEYSKILDMFLIYINKKVPNQFESSTNKELEEVIKYWKSNPAFEIDREMIDSYIEDKKFDIYADDLRKKLNIDSYKNLDDAIEEYLDVFGDKGLMSLNLEILSQVLEEDWEDISRMVEEKYQKIKEEYELKRLEDQLFKSSPKYRDMEYIDSLSGLEFEDFLKELFIDFGYKIKDLPYSNDYGADLIIGKGFEEIVIQAKNYSGNVGNKAIQEVVSAKVYYKCDKAMVITNSYYTQNAIKTAQESGVILIDRDELEKILNEGSMYFNSLVS